MAVAPVVEPAVTPPVVEEDDFASAFAELAALGDKTPEQVAADAEKAAADAEKAATVAKQEERPEIKIGAVGESEAKTPEALEAERVAALEAEKRRTSPTTAETPIGDRDTDLLAKFAKAMREESSKPALKTETVETTPAPDPLFTPDEVSFLTTYQTEWPDVARATNLMLRAMSTQITNHMFTEVAKTLGPRLQMLESLADRQHQQDLYGRVNDYDVVRDKVIAWVGTQKPYLQAAYNKVISEGDVEEVSDLIDRWRKDTGTAVTPTTPKPPVTTTTELSTEAKKAAAALAPVGSKRSAAVRTIDPMDFDGAFAAFAAEVS